MNLKTFLMRICGLRPPLLAPQVFPGESFRLVNMALGLSAAYHGLAVGRGLPYWFRWDVSGLFRGTGGSQLLVQLGSFWLSVSGLLALAVLAGLHRLPPPAVSWSEKVLRFTWISYLGLGACVLLALGPPPETPVLLALLKGLRGALEAARYLFIPLMLIYIGALIGFAHEVYGFAVSGPGIKAGPRPAMAIFAWAIVPPALIAALLWR